MAGLFKEAAVVLSEDEWPGFFEVHPNAAEGSKIRPLPLPENVSKLIQDYIDGPLVLALGSPHGFRRPHTQAVPISSDFGPL